MSKQIRLPRLLFRWLPPLLWMAVIYFASDQSTLPQLEEPWLDVLLKKTAHFLEYALLAFLWWRAWSGSRSRALWPLIASGLISVLYAVSDEYHQTFVPGRHGQLWDLGVDSAGVLFALGLMWQRSRSRSRT